MAKTRINLNKDVPEEKVETPVEVAATPPEEIIEPEKSVEKEIKYPQIAGNGRYQAVQVGEGFVVYNPLACRVSGIITLTQANDIVRQQNHAAHIKG